MAFKICVIGCGWVSTACHGPAYQEYASAHAYTVLGACCDVDLEQAERFRRQFGFQRAYTSFLEMLEVEHPQAVCLNVPPHLAAEMGCAILTRGYPLLTEKPPGLNTVEIDRLIAAAKKSRVIHQVAFNRRFMPVATELKRQLESLTVQHIDVTQARVQRTDENFATTAVHVIDSARFIAGSDYQQVHMTYQELPEIGTGVANFLLDAVFVNGTTGHLSIHPVTGVNIERSVVYAIDHTFFLQAPNGPDAPGRLIHYHNSRLVSNLDAQELTQRREDYYLNGFYHEDAAFFDAAQAGVQPVHDFQSARQPVAIMQCLAERKDRYP